MPAFVKTPKDEAKWAKAKKHAADSKKKDEGSFDDQDWALVNHIYHQMKKAEVDRLAEILEKAKRRLSDEWDPEAEAYGDYEPKKKKLTVFDPEDQQEDEADKWLKEHDSQKETSDEKAQRDDEETHGEDGTSQAGRKEAGTKTEEKSGSAPQKAQIKDLDPERLSSLKEVSRHWLDHADQVRKQTANARLNPHLFAEGHRIAAHNAAHEDFHSAHRALQEKPEYKDASEAGKMRMERDLKKEWAAKGHTKNAVDAVAEAHKMHGAAADLHAKEKAARDMHLKQGGASAAGDTYSSAEAAQHVGAAQDEDGGYATSIEKDPTASMAQRHSTRLHQIPDQKITAEDEEAQLANPEMKTIKHPVLDDPNNKKLINDFVKDFHPLIERTAHRARSQAMASGIPESKLDMSDLHEAGLHGLMQAVRDYNPELGHSFKSHAGSKMHGLMQSRIASQDTMNRDTRAKLTAQEKGIIPEAKPVEAPAPAAPKVASHEVIAGSGHPNATDMGDRLKRISAQKVIVRKKGQQ